MHTTDTLERITPDVLNKEESTGAETLELHLQRYRFASKHLQPGHVLDIACGVGYGSALLAENDACQSVTGVDIDAGAVAYAQSRYTHPKVRFINHNALTYRGDRLYDTIVSLETIEHIPDPGTFVRHLRSLLRPGGYLIGSVPTTPSVDANPHHVTDFTPASFDKLFTDLGFTAVDRFDQVQPFSFWKIVRRKEKRAENMRANMLGYYASTPSALFKRLFATLRYGFTNRYTTVVWRLNATERK